LIQSLLLKAMKFIEQGMYVSGTLCIRINHFRLPVIKCLDNLRRIQFHLGPTFKIPSDVMPCTHCLMDIMFRRECIFDLFDKFF